MTTEQIDLGTADTAQPWRVIDIVGGYRRALAVLGAWRLDVFTELGHGPRSARQLAEKLGLHREALRDLLHALAGLDLVTLDEHGDYTLTPHAHCLVPDRPGYIGGFLDNQENEVHPAWRGLADTLRTGLPTPRDDDSPYTPMYASQEQRDGFLDAMDFIVAPLARQLAARDWSRFRTVLDVGGARGSLATTLVEAHPHLRATVFDLPELAPAFARFTAGRESADRLGFEGGDFFRDPLPRADAVILGHVLHNWPPDVRRSLIRSAADAVNPGGALLIYDAMLDEDTPRLINALLSLDMRMWSGGSQYLADDCVAWLTEAGFQNVERHPHGASSSLVVGHKP
ncbi:methyltransferase [Streptomyces ipomoeae]|uniref:O-methyltransferase n=2 Tax=Streptomyces ipomoeae TaxID=103232 RepID=L1L2E5_9ACTN|nr:methyltransferase [Streptomyces ipomoeae]EKX66860.1 O-methyltransferase [Streptomyces ipomoeae 91-03]MDX2693191.1 methyltransferase [Streptomyces ipomoeae]MDX2820634.1 methyltransferase [Streptomyces ipomoeae]MDX2838697.1 methyltransferase [Streptomyces ipomoeae]MDX2873142.1 methyltransferase [Streptomyces ipomoeae]